MGTRRLLLAVALLLGAGAVPANAASTGELVLVADRSASGTVTVPAAAKFLYADVATKAPQVGVAFVRNGTLLMGGAFYPTATGAFGLVSGSTLPKGALTVRLVTTRPVTLRLRFESGLRGRRTVRLTGPLSGHVALTHDVPKASGPTTADDIPFTVSGRSWVMHVATYTTGTEPRVHSFCVAAPRVPCDLVLANYDVDQRGSETTDVQPFEPGSLAGAQHAAIRDVHPTGNGFAIRHQILAIPVG